MRKRAVRKRLGHLLNGSAQDPPATSTVADLPMTTLSLTLRMTGVPDEQTMSAILSEPQRNRQPQDHYPQS
jgi:hypothetical protein